ncbi:MAG: hypothetical protein CMI01_03760 [Oceanospirillaceae bacterium]|nr:hypothetical protein [Oceanospirillaceae bacterium]
MVHPRVVSFPTSVWLCKRALSMQARVNLHPRRPVHVKLAILLMVSLVVVLGGSFLYTSYMARDSFRYDLDNRVARLETYADLLTEPVAQGRQEQIEAILDLVMDEADTLRLEILNAQVQPLTERLSSDFGRVQVESRFVIPLISGREMGEEAGWFIAEVSAQTLYLAERERLEDTFLTLILVAVALSAALFVFQTRVVNRPLRELLFAIQRARETGDFIRAKSRGSGDEFGIIISSYNELLDELDNKHNSLKESETRFRNLYNQTPALLFTLLPDGRIQSVSEHFLIHLGFNERDIVGRSIAHLACDEKELNTLRDELKQVAPDTSSECYLQVRDRAGEVHSMRINLTANPQGQGALAVMTDITSLDEALSTIERQANFDSLTTLPNRHFFKLMLAEQLTSDQSLEQGLALLFIDLDRFKYINDTHGHHTGDKLLAAAGQRIQHHLPAGDFVARLGGDEFAVLLHGRKEEAALLQLAEGIVEELERPFGGSATIP